MVSIFNNNIGVCMCSTEYAKQNSNYTKGQATNRHIKCDTQNKFDDAWRGSAE